MLVQPSDRLITIIGGSGFVGRHVVRALARRGVDDVHLLELEDAPGGNSRAHAIGGMNLDMEDMNKIKATLKRPERTPAVAPPSAAEISEEPSND